MLIKFIKERIEAIQEMDDIGIDNKIDFNSESIDYFQQVFYEKFLKDKEEI